MARALWSNPKYIAVGIRQTNAGKLFVGPADCGSENVGDAAPRAPNTSVPSGYSIGTIPANFSEPGSAPLAATKRQTLLEKCVA